VGNKKTLEQHLSFPLSQAQLHSSMAPLAVHGRQRMKSDSQYMAVSRCCSFLFTLFLCFDVGSPRPPVPSGISSALMSSTGFRGNSAPVPGASPPPPLSLTLVSAGLLLSFLFSYSNLPAHYFGLSKTRYHRGSTSLAEGLSCALWWVHCS